jgi:hypothetical protein
MDMFVPNALSEPTGQDPNAGSVQSSEPTQGKSVDSEFLDRFNRMASKEAALRKREIEMKSERESWKQKVDRLERLERLKEEDPEAALQELGLNYDSLTERRLSSMGSEQDKLLSTMQKELQSLKSQLELKEKSQQEQAAGQALQQANDQVRQMCESDDFELIRANEAYDLVLDTAAEYYHSTGKMVTLEEAAKHVEAHLEKKLEAILAAKKVAARIKPKEPDATEQASQVARDEQEGRSLSTSMNASSRPSLAQSEDDLRQAALRALRGS